MRIRIITTRYKKIMYAFDFETKEAKEDFFGYYEDIIEALQPKNEEWVEDFKKLVQTLQSRTDDKYAQKNTTILENFSQTKYSTGFAINKKYSNITWNYQTNY